MDRSRLRSPLLVAASLAFAATAAADTFWYERAPRESAPLPDRYTSALPAWFEPEPSFGTWRRRIDQFLDGPTHLQWRLCRGDAAVQDRVVEAVRRAFAGPSDEWIEAQRQLVVGSGCGPRAREEIQLRCEWLRRVVRSEPAGRVRDEFFSQLLACATPEDLALFEADAPDLAVSAFHRDRGPFGWSDRLAAALRNGFAASDPYRLQSSVEALSRIDDHRVARLLLDLLDRTEDAELRRILSDGLVHQSDPDAFEAYRHEWLLRCEARRDARASDPASGRLLMLGYAMADTCDETALHPTPPPARERRDEVVAAPPRDAFRASLARFALDERLFDFPNDNTEAVGSHAPLMRMLIDLLSPDLDDLVLEEVWPALDGFVFDRGPARGFTVLDHMRFTLGVRDEREVAQITEELRAALAEPHWVDAYLDDSRLRFTLRPLGRRFDVETVVGAMNQLLELRGSEQRLVLLTPDREHWWPRILAGPRARLLDAIRAGVVRPATAPPEPSGDT